MATIINTRLKEQRQERLKKHKGASVKKIKKTQRKVKSNDSLGDIHYIDPSHVVNKKEIKKYIEKKGNKNYRPVAIVKKNKDETVNIAKIYGSPNDKHRTKLSTTKMKKPSWIDKQDLSESKSTGKKFKNNKFPLNNKKGKLTIGDLNRRDKKKKKQKGHIIM